MEIQKRVPDNYICYDYLSFSSKIDSQYSIIDLLGLSDLHFENLKGFYGYQDRLYYDGISIHYRGRDDMGICVEMSGKGCRAFEKYGSGDYDGIFSLILDHYSDDTDKREMNITRLDVAYDDFHSVLDLDLLASETIKHNFVSRFRDWQVIQGNKGAGVNHGSNKSTVYIRIYDKRLEQNAQELLDHWVRCELQIRKESALGFIKLQGSVQKKYFSVLNNYLRYIEQTSTRLELCETASYWKDFLDYADKERIFCKPADSYSFNNLYAFVNNQVSGAVSTYIECVGVNQFLKDIHDSRKGKKLNEKYHTLLSHSQKNGSELLKYLQENNLL